MIRYGEDNAGRRLYYGVGGVEVQEAADAVKWNDRTEAEQFRQTMVGCFRDIRENTIDNSSPAAEFVRQVRESTVEEV